jgi:acetolactate synthase-1/3 small subunit
MTSQEAPAKAAQSTSANGTVEARKHTVVALVENKPGVLNRVVSMFRRRNFNLDSLTVGRTHKPHISRMTIVVDATRANARQIVSNLYKLISVIDVRLVSAEPHVSRDLALVKVRTDESDSFNAVTEICERTPARIVDMGTKVCIVEICAPEDVVESVIEMLRPIGIYEMVRTGVVAMGRGTRILDSTYEPYVPVVPGANGAGSEHRYSV